MVCMQWMNDGCWRFTWLWSNQIFRRTSVYSPLALLTKLMVSPTLMVTAFGVHWLFANVKIFTVAPSALEAVASSKAINANILVALNRRLPWSIVPSILHTHKQPVSATAVTQQKVDILVSSERG